MTVRRVARLALAAAVLLLFAGCRRNGDDGHATHITVWTMWTGQEEKNFQRVLDRYHEMHPNVVIENLGAVNDDTKTVRAIVAGVPPDFFTLSDPLYLGPLAANGALFALDDRFATSGLRREDLIPASLRQCEYRHKLYALPFLIDLYALLWDKKAFREVGLDPERPPQTLEELKGYALRLTKREDGKLERLGLMPVGDLNILNPFFGGSLYDEATNRITADHPGNIAALEWYIDLVNRMGGYQEVNAFAAGFGQAQSANNPFYVGKVAMMMNGEWNPYWCYRYAPALDYGVAPIPAPASHPDRKRSTFLGGNMFCIPKGSKHPNEAWDFMVWMQSDEAQALFAGMMNNVPNRRSTLRSPALRTGKPYRPKYGVFLDLADSPNAAHFPALPVANLYNSSLTTERDMVLNGRKTPRQALADARLRVQRELDRYR